VHVYGAILWSREARTMGASLPPQMPVITEERVCLVRRPSSIRPSSSTSLPRPPAVEYQGRHQ
jgi:hypothetical protein